MTRTDFINGFLNFSKKERRAHYVLAALVLLVFIAPSLLPFFMKKNARPADDGLKQMAAALTAGDDDTAARKYKRYATGRNETRPFRRYWEEDDDAERAPERLFYFDPNVLPPEGWLQLGLREKTVATIQKYLSKGGRFYRPDDLDRVYGLSKRLAETLKPYVRIEPDDKPFARTHTDTGRFAFSRSAKSSTHILDINTADTAAFKTLPGIGSGWARRIVNFREKLGGFYTAAQVAETFGLPDSVYQKIQGQLQCNPDAVRKINVNTADTAELRRHPYISRNLANNIVQYRRQHGLFQSLDGLKRLALMKEDILAKLLPYLKLE
jgi:competence protein ComEA